MAGMYVTGPVRLVHKTKNLAADKRRQDYRKQQLVKKMNAKKNGLAVNTETNDTNDGK